ncbi:peptide/nickel transport system permease protein [Sporobacter termitidis DSM 10068]|uniref:Peptide/nickel transport system permease protein n=1 Tax=Sporobacter termitidis DSM 10068 TaxID=1123282 RepID=A0A1M5XHE4_9FIRM|nr:ABC transporter permease [Sporobacter termitidis]SHH99169.1 peptide/nickel transport system permease protein [Sporobacter termitidis DSM 10068]
MLTYIVRRLIHAFVVIVIVSIAVFILIRLLPGDPIEMLISQTQLTETTPEMIEALRHDKGLDRPLPVQYADWFVQMIRGDFGTSIMRNFDIGKEIGNRVTVTLMIGLSAFVIGLVLGPILGIVSAVRRGKFVDNLVTVIANIGITAPAFWVGILLIFFFGVRLKLLPIYGYTLPWDDFWMSFKQSLMPIFVTALGPIATTARQTRSSVLEVMSEDYIRTAWAKGLNERKVILRHIIKNSLLPVVTLQGTMLRMVVGGSVVVETVFVIPGMGKMMVDAMLSHDYPVVQAVTVIMTLVVVLSSLIVDLLYGWLDPRIQYD